MFIAPSAMEHALRRCAMCCAPKMEAADQETTKNAAWLGGNLVVPLAPGHQSITTPKHPPRATLSTLEAVFD